MNINDIEINVIKAKANDKEAIMKLYEAFKPYLFSLLLKYNVPGYDKHDILNEYYIWLIKAIKYYNPNNTFTIYLTNSIRNNLFYLLKKNTKLTMAADPIPPIDYTLCICLDILLNSLSQIEKTILIDYFFKEISLKDISKKLNMKYITTVKIKDRALQKLRKKI